MTDHESLYNIEIISFHNLNVWVVLWLEVDHKIAYTMNRMKQYTVRHAHGLTYNYHLHAVQSFGNTHFYCGMVTVY